MERVSLWRLTVFIDWFRISCLLLVVGCDRQQALEPVQPKEQPLVKGSSRTAVDASTPAYPLHLIFEDDLSGPSLSTRWRAQLTHLESGEAGQHFQSKALRLGLNTLKRQPGQISVHSLVREERLDWTEDSVTIQFGIRWLEKKNASYLSAGLILVPEGLKEGADPRLAERNLAVFFTGVPPAANARRVARLRKASSTVWEDLQGWPEKNKEGRSLEDTELQLTVSDDALRLREPGYPDLLIRRPIGFTAGRLILFVASQSNAPLRWAGFHSLRVSRGSVD